MNRRIISLLCFAPTISGYCAPGDLCWPNQAAWEELGASLDGELRAYAVPDVWNSLVYLYVNRRHARRRMSTLDTTQVPDQQLDEPVDCAACEADPFCRLNSECMQYPDCSHGFCQNEAAWNLPARVAEVASADDVSTPVRKLIFPLSFRY